MKDPFYYLSDRFAKLIGVGLVVAVVVGIVGGLIQWVVGLF